MNYYFTQYITEKYIKRCFITAIQKAKRLRCIEKNAD